MAFEDQRTTVYKVDRTSGERRSRARTEELLLNMGPQHPAPMVSSK